MSQNNPPSSISMTDALRETLVIILAGGRGERLKQLTDAIAKPAVPFGGKFRIIDFALSNCVNSGLRRVGVLTQYNMHVLAQHVQAGWGTLRAEFGEFIQVWPAQQKKGSTDWYQGTADAVFQNLDLIVAQKPKYVIVLGGDHIYRQDYRTMLRDHINKGADVSVSCITASKEEAKAFGVMGVDGDDRIVDFVEKPANPPTLPGDPNSSLVSMGIYVFNTDVLVKQLTDDAETDASSHDFGKDLIPNMVPTLDVFAHRFSDSCVYSEGSKEAYWRDVGELDSYWSANMDLTAVTPTLDLYDRKWPIWTYHAQLPGAKFVFDDDERRGMAVDSVVSSGCVVSGSTVRRSLLFSGVRIHSYCNIEDSVLLNGAAVGRRCVLKKVIVAEGCEVPPGTVVGVNPEEDARYFHRTKGGVTLITDEDLAKLPKP
ncbi:glucose-1-phosphate adenylyltransferase [Magnetofaba australis]|nr:glucose-1-phosphate adenylyltransferase [Magnetofaba australis]